jgi:hypothetical protein
MGGPVRGVRPMAPAPSSTNRPRRQARLAPPTPRWRRWLLLGLLFGLGYGLTQRFLDLRWEEDGSRPPAFRSKATSGGTTLEELRRRHGNQARPLTADLEALAREKQEEQKKKEAARREEAARLKAAKEEEKTSLDSERRRLEEINRPPEPEAPEPSRQPDALLSTPPTPELPPPEPSTPEPTPQPSLPPPTVQP